MSLRKAIDAKCRECIYDPHSGDGTWRQQVEGCTSPKCPLFAVRPLPDYRDRNKRTKSRREAENRQIGGAVDAVGGVA
jgi:hypothetical protein